jgi:hypothetical protein
MDPYLEDPALWPDFHDALAGEIRALLNRNLPEPYYAQLGVREEIDIIGEGTTRRIIPDVAVRRSAGQEGTSLAILDSPRVEVDESFEVAVDDELREVNFVEIRDSRRKHEVITLIEILSPSNKHPGWDAQQYRQKRNEVFGSGTSLVEVDLLRTGDRSWLGAEVVQRIADFDPSPEYVALVQRAWKRSSRLVFDLYPVPLNERLPVIGVPLREGDSESALDLQFAFQEAYDRGPYRRGAVDYSQPPLPPLSEESAAFIAARLAGMTSGKRANP